MDQRSSRTARRALLLAIGMVSMAWAVWLGLVRLGWPLPLPLPDQLIAHGPLIVCGFLGTLISLERAVALGARWAYAAPVPIAAGALLLILGFTGPTARLLISIGSLVLVVILALMWLRQASLFLVTIGLGAVAWSVGNLLWLADAAIFRVVFWWLAFPVLTIAGERLELSRLLQPTGRVRLAFVATIGLILAGVLTAARWPAPGARVLGGGLIALAWWLARHDVARRTIRQRGVTRFMAVCLLGGYAWLGVGGTIGVITGSATPGVIYDAMLHAVFLGFVMSMVFAHAPVIFPSVLGIAVPYRSALYLHVSVLHVSLLLRVAGDLVDTLGRWRVWGGLLNAVALLLFVVTTAGSIVVSRRVARDSPGSVA